MTAQTKRISFTKEEGLDFTTVLRKRVSHFFTESGLSQKANTSMVLKSVFWMGLIGVIYSLLISNVAGGIGALFFYSSLGFLISLGTMNIAHDALHGAYVSGSKGNRALGYVMDLFGASSFYWKKEHTIDHHTYTNIAEHDADLMVPIVLRLCPKAPQYFFHRFQHFYAPILYSLNFLHWIYVSDFKRIYRILTNQMTGLNKPSFKEALLLIAFKALHIYLFLVLPLMYLPISPWYIVLGYLGYLAAAGITATVIFQLAHIVENVAFPLPNEEGKIENSFMQHQLATTSNFATNSKIVKFLFGGLNFQVEHHIFPHVCHMHLSKIAPIVKATAEEFGLPYHENASFFGAVRSHFRTLKKMGTPSKLVA